MKAKVIETGEIVNVKPYPRIYQEKGQGSDRREWYEDDLEFEPVTKRVLLDKACSGIEKLLSGYIIRNFHFGDSYDIDKLIEDFKEYMKEE